MTILTILKYPNQILTYKSEEVGLNSTPERQRVDDITSDMVQTMDYNRGVGLAGIQVGYPLRLVVIRLQSGGLIRMANPKITQFKGKLSLKEEGCLSFPKAYTYVKRYSSVLCSYYNVDSGTFTSRLFSNRDAHVLQHELCHLEGQLIPDVLGEILGRVYVSKYNQLNHL